MTNNELELEITMTSLSPLNMAQTILRLTNRYLLLISTIVNRVENNKSNLDSGIAAWCLDAIVRNIDLLVSRVCIQKDTEEGQSISDKLSKIKRMTAISIFLHG